MIIREYYMTRKDGVRLYRTYSNNKKMIIQMPTNIEYSEAIDVETAPYYYIESEKDIVEEENDEVI